MSLIGLRVGPFEIVATAEVPEDGSWYLARRTGMTRRQPAEVLVCLLEPDAPADARAALQRRFEALRGVEDPRVPEAVAFYEGLGALAVSNAQGTPLRRIVEGRRAGTVVMTPATLLDVILEVAETLQHLHHRGRVHGHLSADQVVLGPDGRVWVWGLGEGAQRAPDPEWCAPERARREPPGEATDQWGLAALAAALITGHAPWRGEDPSAEALRGEIDAVVEPVERQWPALGRVLRRMLDSRPANRFPSLHPVRQELLGLARKAGGTSDRRELAATLAGRTPAVDDETVPLRFEAQVSHDPVPAAPTGHPPADEVAAAPPSDARPSEDETVRLEPTPAPEEDATVQLSAGDPSSEPDVQVASARLAEPASRGRPEPTPGISARLPEEQIPVVRPEVPGEVPTARLGADGSGPPRWPSFDDAGDAPSIAPEEGDLLAAMVDLEDSEEVQPVDAPALFQGDDEPDAFPAADSDAGASDADADRLVLPGDLGGASPPNADEPEATVLIDASVLPSGDPDTFGHHSFDDELPEAAPPPDLPAEDAPAPPPRGPSDAELGATPLYSDRLGPAADEAGDEEEFATVVFDASMLGDLDAAVEAYGVDEPLRSGPTMVPATDPSESDESDEVGGGMWLEEGDAEPKTGDGPVLGRRPGDVTGGSGPELGDLPDPDEPQATLPDPTSKPVTRAAQVLVLVMLVLMLAWMLAQVG